MKELKTSIKEAAVNNESGVSEIKIADSNGIKRNELRVKAIVMGALTGVISGLLGGGGGTVVVPFLINVFGLEVKEAHATAIFIMLPVTVISSIAYLFSGAEWHVSGITVALGVATGGFLGAVLTGKIKSEVLAVIFSVSLLITGVLNLF